MIDLFNATDLFWEVRISPSVKRICLTCKGEQMIPDEDGYMIVCPGPCRGTGKTDLPQPEKCR